MRKATNTRTHTHNREKNGVPIVSAMLAALEHKIPISSQSLKISKKKETREDSAKKRERNKSRKNRSATDRQQSRGRGKW